jgi:hypothetical protein
MKGADRLSDSGTRSRYGQRRSADPTNPGDAAALKVVGYETNAPE